jgi:hypothetical protein
VQLKFRATTAQPLPLIGRPHARWLAGAKGSRPILQAASNDEALVISRLGQYLITLGGPDGVEIELHSAQNPLSPSSRSVKMLMVTSLPDTLTVTVSSIASNSHR